MATEYLFNSHIFHCQWPCLSSFSEQPSGAFHSSSQDILILILPFSLFLVNATPFPSAVSVIPWRLFPLITPPSILRPLPCPWSPPTRHTPTHYRVVLSCQMERYTSILQASLYMHYLSLCMSFQDGAVFHCISSFISDEVTCLHHGDVKTSLTTIKKIYCTTYELCFHSKA